MSSLYANCLSAGSLSCLVAPAPVTPMQSCGWGRRTPQWRVWYEVIAVHSDGAETPGSAAHSLNHVGKTIVFYTLRLLLSPIFLFVYFLLELLLQHKLQAARCVDVCMCNNTSGLQIWSSIISHTKFFFHTSQTLLGLSFMSTYTKAHKKKHDI